MPILKTRRLLIPRLLNLRDLGGYAAGDGVTRFGVFLRADEPTAIDDQGVQALYDYGVRLAVDLRAYDEMTRYPSKLRGDSGIETVHIPIFDASTDFDMDTYKTLLEMYIHFAEDTAPRFVEVMRCISKAEGAVLFHCSAGKDRTGITAAFLLELAGVSRMDIAADYALTATYIRPRFEKIKREEIPMTYLSAEAKTIEQLLAHIDEHYGGVRAYLNRFGLSRACMDELAGRLVAYC